MKKDRRPASEGPSLPPHLEERIREIRPSFELVWNPQAARLKDGHIDASGNLISPEFEGRFELWDETPDSPRYRLLTCQHEDGSYRHPEEWLIRTLQIINPARYGGSVEKAMEELVDQKDLLKETVADREWDALAEWFVDEFFSRVTPNAPVGIQL